jgi:hypothetical protein
VKFLLFAFLTLISANAMSQEYAPGQTWLYKTREIEKSSTLTVLKVEQYDDLGEVVHIRIDQIKMANPIKGNEITDIPHLPFKKSALDASVTQLKGITSVPGFQEGYDTWKAAYDADQAGAFETTVRETLDAMLGAEWIEKE